MPIKSPIVSVIISAHNRTKYLSAMVDSVLKQTFSDFEVLIFHDDNSHDVEWLSLLHDERLKLISQDNLGVAQAFNLGIIEGRGKYIAFLDDGYLWHPHKLQKQVLSLDHYPEIGLVHSWLMLIDQWGKSTGKILKHDLSGWIESEILERNQIGYQSVMVRRRCFDVVGLFDSQLQITPDWDMWIRLSRRFQFMAIAESLVYYRQQENISFKNWLVMETDFQTTIEKAYANAPDELVDLKYRSYANASLCLAWQVLQSQEPDPVIADNYCRQALEHSPVIGFSRDFFQVSMAVLMMRYLKSDRYYQLLLWTRANRSWLRAIINKFRRYAHNLLNWILEEEDGIIFWKSKIKQEGKK